MSVDGTWHLTLQTPIGEQKTSVTLSSAGGALTGRQSQGAASADIRDGTLSGDTVGWKVSITDPVPLTLAFSGTVSGDSISGKADVTGLGSWKFVGTRAA
jgi:hypothetical protein